MVRTSGGEHTESRPSAEHTERAYRVRLDSAESAASCAGSPDRESRVSETCSNGRTVMRSYSATAYRLLVFGLGILALGVLSACRPACRVGEGRPPAARPTGALGLFVLADLHQFAEVTLRQIELFQPKPEDYADDPGTVEGALHKAAVRWWQRSHAERVAHVRKDVTDRSLVVRLAAGGSAEVLQGLTRHGWRFGSWRADGESVVMMLRWEPHTDPPEKWLFRRSGDTLIVLEPAHYVGRTLRRAD
jgi:hypothetical protein